MASLPYVNQTLHNPAAQDCLEVCAVDLQTRSTLSEAVVVDTSWSELIHLSEQS